MNASARPLGNFFSKSTSGLGNFDSKNRGSHLKSNDAAVVAGTGA